MKKLTGLVAATQPASAAVTFTETSGSLAASASFDIIAGNLQQPAPTNPASNIVGWDGLNLSSFGAGLNGTAEALETFKYSGTLSSFELIAGGFFTQAGSVAASNIARWTDTPTYVFPKPIDVVRHAITIPASSASFAPDHHGIEAMVATKEMRPDSSTIEMERPSAPT